MITDNQAKEAIKTIAEYCSQNPYDPCCGQCSIKPVCLAARNIGVVPEDWPKYLRREK